MNLSTILWIMTSILVISLLIVLYLFWKDINKDRMFIITRDNKLAIKKINRKMQGKIQLGKGTYILEGAIPNLTFPPWRQNYFFDEDTPTPRKISYKKNEWYGTDTITKIINDEHLKQLTQEAITPQIKLFIILGAISGFLSLLSSIIILANITGLIK